MSSSLKSISQNNLATIQPQIETPKALPPEQKANIELPKQPEIRQTKSTNEGGLEPPISDPKLISPVSNSENDELYNFEGTTQGDITTKGNNV
eukprot:CAMPEP_0114653510 /NCGR_PEP_ID=MMETSP0191-20121206/9819_1 /TAXON_ID=126664 /ORGANISM="Sorites sp." /LENGTH=92 /DNA_ID=CAMNT_0001868603 /DNA_START=368 /DNA_END=646 /DNA_ORIENTATION=+